MPQSTDLQPLGGVSPFDALRQHDEYGEFWSARDLMGPLGYSRWQTFTESIDRARASAEATGLDALSMFVQVTQLTGAGNLGEQSRSDYRLTRMAAYLVAMNGDARKTEVAAAQHYFAVKTREAETAPRRELSPRELAQLVIEAEDRREAAEKALEAAKPAIEGYGQLVDATGLLGLAEAAGALGMGRQRFIAKLGEMRFLIVRPGTPDHLRPYVEHVHNGRATLKLGTYDHPKTGEVMSSRVTMITPKGLAYIQRKISEGRAR